MDLSSGRSDNSGSFKFLAVMATIGLASFLVAPAHALDPSRELTEYAIDVWTGDDGLPQNAVNSLAQTADGYLWVGTEGGLARFDGLTFTVFDSENTSVLLEDDIQTLLGDSLGNLWIGTIAGLYRYRNGDITAFREEDDQVHKIKALFEDSQGRIWVAAEQEHLRVIEDGHLRVFEDPEGGTLLGGNGITERPDGSVCFASADIYCLDDGIIRSTNSGESTTGKTVWNTLAMHEGRIVAGSLGGGVGIEKGAGDGAFNKIDGIPHEMINSIEVDSHGELWVATFGGLSRVRQGGVQSLSTEDGLTHPSIRVVMEDHEGSIWLGTGGGGLIRLRDRQLGTLSVKQGLASVHALAVLQDRDGYMWFVTSAGNLQRYRNGEWRMFGAEDGLPKCDINALWEGEPGTQWIGTGTGGIFRFRDDRIESVPSASKVILAGFTDTDGTVWAGGPNGLQDLRAGRFEHPEWCRDLRKVSTIHRDRAGTLWIGTFGLGLNRFHDGKLEVYTTEDGLSSNNILSFYEDRGGVLWIATYGGGLSRLEDGSFTTITTGEGLPHDQIYGVLEDDHGRMWLSTPEGIVAIAREELNALAEGAIESVNPVTFGTADGMRNAECNGGFQPAGWKTRDGKLWFPTVDGFVNIDPARMAENRPPPPVLIERIISDGRDLELATQDSALVVSPGRGNLEFHYTGLSFLDPGSIRFRYLLEGFDDTWTDAGTRRTAYYTNVPSGRYTFRVNACNNAGSWNEADTVVSLRLAPHFYQSYWFYGANALVVGLALFGLHRYRVTRVLEMERVRTRISIL